ncbi:MAG: signal recognition particle-docking protein FtsY, partial [Acidimicrobiales bacterium]|nr:signal recognition particle-docking protein FtsY [Acidimicrobiales bacterium]
MAVLIILIVIILAIVILAVLGGSFLLSQSRRSTKSQELQDQPIQEPLRQTKTSTAVVEDAELEPIAEEEISALDWTPPKLEDRLSKAKGLFGGYLPSVLGRGTILNQSWDDLEEALVLADVGLMATNAILENLKIVVKQQKIKEPNELIAALKTELVRRLEVNDVSTDLSFGKGGPTVWLFVGVNGVGKTTTIGKLAAREVKAGKKVLLAAGDTFRAAASEQLEHWAERSGADITKGSEGADPSSVIFDAIEKAAARNYDLVLADTAGRLHTKANLMEELKKVRRVASKEPGHLCEVLLVLDATTGQNGLIQASEFKEATDLTGVVLTKLDGTAKGGIAIAISESLGIPIKLIGIGE